MCNKAYAYGKPENNINGDTEENEDANSEVDYFYEKSPTETDDHHSIFKWRGIGLALIATIMVGFGVYNFAPKPISALIHLFGADIDFTHDGFILNHTFASQTASTHRNPPSTRLFPMESPEVNFSAPYALSLPASNTTPGFLQFSFISRQERTDRDEEWPYSVLLRNREAVFGVVFDGANLDARLQTESTLDTTHIECGEGGFSPLPLSDFQIAQPDCRFPEIQYFSFAGLSFGTFDFSEIIQSVFAPNFPDLENVSIRSLEVEKGVLSALSVDATNVDDFVIVSRADWSNGHGWATVVPGHSAWIVEVGTAFTGRSILVHVRRGDGGISNFFLLDQSTGAIRANMGVSERVNFIDVEYGPTDFGARLLIATDNSIFTVRMLSLDALEIVEE